MEFPEFENMVRETADRFAARHSVLISDGSIDEIIQPAIDHLDEVNADLKSGKMTKALLEDSVYTILVNAQLQGERTQSDRIGRSLTKKSIDYYCPYLFWC